MQTTRSGVQRAGAYALAFVFALMSGCATVPLPQSTRHQTALGSVAVIAAPYEPEIAFEGFSRSKGEGAASAGGEAFLSCLSALGRSSCSGFICGPVIIIWLGICGVAATAGGVAGAAATPGAEQVQAAEATLTKALEVATIQDSLRGQVESAALLKGALLASVPPASAPAAGKSQDYRPLAATGVETVLEVGLTRTGTSGHGINPPLQLSMDARARVISTGNNTEIFAADFTYLGERFTLSEWAANDGERLLRALRTGYETLGAHIHDNVFLLYPFPDRGVQSAGLLSAAFGLAPLYPLTRGQLTGDRIIGDRFEWTTVASSRPTLRWQAFPRAADIVAAPEDMGRVKNIRYDLIIAREHNLAPAEVVYRREGLPEAHHALETSLSSGTHYFWTVRARFELDSRERVTEWGSTHYMARERYSAPSHLSYRFKTP
jgi:hypothetical protein